MTEKREPVCIYEVSVLLLNAGLDTNGNGRRSYLAVHPQEGILFCIDASDRTELQNPWFGTEGGKILEKQVMRAPLRIKAAERKQLMKEYTIKSFRTKYRFVDREGKD